MSRKKTKVSSLNKKIAVFPGNGSNFQARPKSFQGVCLSDHQTPILMCRQARRSVLCFELKEFESKTDYEAALVELLEEHQVDLVCLAGYMKIVGQPLLVLGL